MLCNLPVGESYKMGVVGYDRQGSLIFPTSCTLNSNFLLDNVDLRQVLCLHFYFLRILSLFQWIYWGYFRLSILGLCVPYMLFGFSSLKLIIHYFHTLFPARILTFPAHNVCACAGIKEAWASVSWSIESVTLW